MPLSRLAIKCIWSHQLTSSTVAKTLKSYLATELKTIADVGNSYNVPPTPSNKFIGLSQSHLLGTP